MIQLPEIVLQQWEKREGPAVFTTVNQDGLPNSIYAGCVHMTGDGRFFVVDNKFEKTKDNILAGSTGSFLFITDECKAFQIKGTIEYHTEGEIYDAMKKWVNPKYPAFAVAVVNTQEVYSGAERLA